jgi:ABC-type lipopolysaccharide export system ATPase subunit
MNHILEIDSVILEFGDKRVLQDIYLKLETGKVTGLLGRNGAGKSCLMNIICGELVPKDKSIRLDSKTIYKENNMELGIRYLPQFHFIPRHLTIARIFKDFKIDFQEFVLLFPEYEKYYKTAIRLLSGGERRIIEIYCILSTQSLFCLLDEPFSMIMPRHVETIKSVIEREKSRKGILITDHLYRHIIDISDSLYVLNFGKTYHTKSLQDIEMLGYARIDD